MGEVSRVRTGPERFFCSTRWRKKSRSRMRKRLVRRDNSRVVAHLEADQGPSLERMGGNGGVVGWGGVGG